MYPHFDKITNKSVNDRILYCEFRNCTNEIPERGVALSQKKVSDEIRYPWYQMVESDFLLLQIIYIYTLNALLYWEADFFER